ncbi:MAG: protein TolQ [Methylococcaceae bacterium]|nr:protein TolQ [Methylococcaceae bacterium]
MSANGSFVQLILEASLVVQLVMLILVTASIVSWTFIFLKRKDLQLILSNAERFDTRFWSGIDLADLYRQLTASNYRSRGVENIFIAGYREFARLRQQSNVDAATLVDGSQRAMRIAMSRELDRLDERLPYLATVGSTSPYVGLFGTVWGIMNSFRALANVQQVTLAMVAPGISEALVATAMGLFAAIPAVVAYNQFATRTERLTTRYEIFMEEFVSLLHRQAKPK